MGKHYEEHQHMAYCQVMEGVQNNSEVLALVENVYCYISSSKQHFSIPAVWPHTKQFIHVRNCEITWSCDVLPGQLIDYLVC